MLYKSNVLHKYCDPSSVFGLPCSSHTVMINKFGLPLLVSKVPFIALKSILECC